MSILNLFNQAEKKVESEVQKIEAVFHKAATVAETDLHNVFAKAKAEAAQANADVETLKQQLAIAIKKAADLSEQARAAAQAAADEAQAKAAALVAEAATHAEIAAQQASQIVVAPAPELVS